MALLWEACARTLSLANVVRDYDVWHFGDSEEVARELLELVVAGRKTATCGLLWEWELGTEASAMPVEGGFSVVTDFHGTPGAILQSTQVRSLPFCDVDSAFALEEGEGTFEEWRAKHWEYFTRRCALIGKDPTESMPLVCERFKVVFLAPRAAR